MNEDEVEKIIEKKLQEWMSKVKKARELVKYPEKPLILNNENFDEEIRKYPYVVVDFWAGWCLPCKVISPIVAELAKEFKGKVVFGRLNVDENFDLAYRFKVMGIPTLIFFRNGEEVDRIIGVASKQSITERMKKNFKI